MGLEKVEIMSTLLLTLKIFLPYLINEPTLALDAYEWGHWQSWNNTCSTTCGPGVKRRKRICLPKGLVPASTFSIKNAGIALYLRLIDRIKNRKKNKMATTTLPIPPASTVEVSTIVVATNFTSADEDVTSKCEGSNVENMPCEISHLCTIDGGWGPWSCTCLALHVTSDSGTDSNAGVPDCLVKRFCENPKPQNGGKNCEGQDFMKGNLTGMCGSQDATLLPLTSNVTTMITLEPKLRKSMNQRLQGMHFNYAGLLQGMEFTLSCFRDNAVDQLLVAYPKSKYVWTLNGRPLDYDFSRMFVDRENLTIQNLRQTDSGVYACYVQYTTNHKRLLSFATITVESKEPDLILKESRNAKFEVPCYGGYIETLLMQTFHNLKKDDSKMEKPKLNLKWKLNGTIYQDFKLDTMPSKVPYIRLRPVTYGKDEGVWTCEVTEMLSTQVWETNRIKLEIIPADSWGVILTRKDSLIYLIILVVLFILVVVWAVSFVSKKNAREIPLEKLVKNA